MRANNSHHLAAAARERAERTRAKALRALQAVSYTHLTLPTSDLV